MDRAPRRIPADEVEVDVPVSRSRAAGVRLVLWKMLHWLVGGVVLYRVVVVGGSCCGGV